MAATNEITQIGVILQTGNRAGADSNGDVFLQIGPREFNLRLPPAPTGSPKERGQGVTNEYTLGQGANIVNKDHNDPRNDLVLKTTDLDGFPVCLRFKGQTDDDTWNLEQVAITATSAEGDTAKWSRGWNHPNNLWLGNKFGNVCYLLQTQYFSVAG